MSEEAAYKPRMVFVQSVVLNSQTTPPHAAALWFPQGFSVEFQPGRLVAISGLFHCWNRFWSANTKGPTKTSTKYDRFQLLQVKKHRKTWDSRPRKPNRLPKTLATKDDDPFSFPPNCVVEAIISVKPTNWARLTTTNFTIPFSKTKCMDINQNHQYHPSPITIIISDLCKYPTFWFISRGFLPGGTRCCNYRNLVPRSQWRRKREQQQQQYKP